MRTTAQRSTPRRTKPANPGALSADSSAKREGAPSAAADAFEPRNPRAAALTQAGQSIWLDDISRELFSSGRLKAALRDGTTGITSNPSIFENAIAKSQDYDADISRLAKLGKTDHEIYETLAIQDIARAAAALRPTYDRTGGADGFVSLEVNPQLANDAAGTVAEAVRLFEALGQPNVMIKVPATPAGVEAVEALTARGINVNVTLIFTPAQYEQVAKAYLSGLEAFGRGGGDLSKVSSVASFFISRVDSAVDAALQEVGTPDALNLRGQAAIANAKVAYQQFGEHFSGPRWEALVGRGAHAQRLLWASTGMKDPERRDTRYVESLIGPQTVNTMPPKTQQAFFNHGEVKATLNRNLARASNDLASIAELGIDLDRVGENLQAAGVASFAKSFATLIAAIAEKRQALAP